MKVNKAIETSLEAIGVFFMLGLGILICMYTFEFTKITISGSTWVTAPAVITYTYSAQLYGSRTGRSGIEYYPSPSYAFVANDGKTYTGKQYAIPALGIRSNLSKEQLDGPTTVDGTIYYNPKNPNESAVLQPLFEPMLPLVFGILGLALVIGAIVIVYEFVKLLLISP